MKKLTLSLCAAVAMATAAYAGETYSKESKSVTPPPCPQWYADNEFNVTLSGAYVWTGNDWRDDRYLAIDHGWGSAPSRCASRSAARASRLMAGSAAAASSEAVGLTISSSIRPITCRVGESLTTASPRRSVRSAAVLKFASLRTSAGPTTSAGTSSRVPTTTSEWPAPV